MNGRKTACGMAMIAALGLLAPAARGGTETFANYTNNTSSYATNTIVGQDGSTWTLAAARGDIALNGKAPTIRNVANAYVRSGTITGGVGTLTFSYRKPFSDANMSNKVLVIGSGNTFTGMVTQVPSTTNEILVYTAATVNVEGDFVLVITNSASTARITIDDVAWTGYSASSIAPSFTSGTSYAATSLVAMAFTVAASGTPAPTLALQSTTASSGYSFTAGTGQLNYTPPPADGGATQTFTFTASNTAGVATQTVSVAVTASTVPAFTSGAAYGATSAVAMAFTVAASGTPAPTLALQSETAAGTVNFTPGTGALNYTPDASDVGVQTFTFTASNVAGVATQAVAVTVANVAVAPSFTSGTSYGATALVATAFTVTASGNPAPTLALQGEDAAGSVAFTPATGVLDYTPATNDVGDRSFVFTASNTAGAATQTVTVAVAAALNAIPTVSVTNVTTNAFTVNWTACTGATNYQMQVATDTNFTVGAGGSNVTIVAVGNTGVSNGWAYVNGASNAGTYHKLVAATAPGVVSAEFSTLGCVAATAAYSVATYGGATANTLLISYSLDGGSNWTVFATNTSATTSTYVTNQGDALPAAALGQASVWIKWHCDVATASVGLRLQALAVVGTQADGSGSLVADATTAGLTYAATGLVMETTYYVRARMLTTGEWSSVVSATTASPTPEAPVFGANPGPLTATTGVARAFAVAATGVPAPALALQSQTASSGYSFVPATGVLTYTAPEADVGAQTFTFTASNATGVATQTVGVTVVAVAPTFNANPGPIAATATLARAFSVGATGYPAPTLALQGTTASTGYVFAAGTGTLTYTAPEADVGTRTFTFAASNVAGVALQTVTVTVASAPVYVPTVALTNVGPTFFTANWNEVTDASTYQIQIGMDTNFSTSVSGSNLLNETFATLTATSAPSGWSSSATLDLISTSIYGAASPSFKFNLTGQTLTSPAFATGATNLQFWAYGRNGSGSTLAISGLVAGVWTQIGTVSVARNGATYNVALDPQTTQIKFRFTKLYTVYFDDVVVQGGAAAGSLVADETVAALTYGATGLTNSTPYYVRVRAAPTGTWSTVVSTTTLGNEPLAPWFTGGTGPYSTTAGIAVAFTETALGVPDPTLALAGATAAADSYAFTPETGYLIYTPPVGDAGTQTFTFTASNATGVATQIVSVAVAAATAPAFAALGTQYATTLVAKVFFVSASGAPTPELALAGTTASAGYLFSPDAGRLSYAPPTNDVGAQTFTFTASNVAGVATQIVDVVVSNMPAVAPTIDAIPPQATMVGLEFDYTVTATDPDTVASNVTFVCTSAVASATWDCDTNTGYFVFIPTTNQIGTNVFSFQATDHPTSLTSPWSNMVVVVSAAGDAVAVSFGSARIVGEEGTSVAIPVTLAYSGSAAVQIRFSGPTNGTARWGADFNCATTLVVSGASSSNLMIDVVSDALAEGPESIKLQLVPVAPATAGSVTQAVLHVRDDDTASLMAANTTSGSNQEYEGPGNRIFQALCPDVVMIQEFNVTNGTTAAAYRTWVNQNFGTNFSYYVQTNGVSIPNGIISRWPITSAGVWDDTTLSDRDFVWAKIQLPGTQQLQAVSVHIKASSGSSDVSQRTTEARALTNYIAQAGWLTNGYIAIAGDFNLYSTNEACMQVLTANTVTDRRQPADQFGDKETNSARENPYDRVLTSTNLDVRLRTFDLWGYSYANGIVYDTRITWASGLPSPSLAADSGATNMQHMAVMKVFELEKDDAVGAPLAFSATPAGPSQNDLSATANALGDDVIVAWDADNTFTTPSGTAPAVGAAFAGGTVIYKGAAGAFSHTGLTACATYYYKCWSYAGTVYSTNGLAASATTTSPEAPASVWASSITNETFTANWSAVAGAASYRLDVCAVPSFSGAAAGWGPVFRETMGTPTAGTTTLAEHEANDGFDNDAYVVSDGGADNPADVRTSTVSTNYVDPAGNAASGGANVYFPTNGLVGSAGFAIAGIDSRGYEALALSFGYYKESPATNMNLALDWSTDGGATWNPIAVSNLPASNATGTNWYLVSGLALDAGALGSTNLSLRWTRQADSVPGRIDDVLLQGYADSAEFAAGYSNRTVTGATSQSVTGLTGGVTYYFRARAVGECEGAWSATGSATPSGTPSAPAFTSANSFGATTGVARTFAVTASGYPLPVLSLQDTTASGAQSFAAGTGTLTYTPSEADYGTRTFSFRATNLYGTAMQTVTVAVAAGAPSAVGSLWASATNATGFTAAWSASALATGYRLDVSTAPTFQVLTGGSAATILASNAATDVSLIAGDWSGTDLVGTNGYVQMLAASSAIVSPAFSTVGFTNLTVDFWARTYGGVTTGSSNVTVSISTNNGAAWSSLGVVAPTNGSAWLAMPTLSGTAYLGHAQTRIRWQTLAAVSNIGVGVKTLVVQGQGPAYAPSFVAGYSNLAVSGTSQAVAGLAESSIYYFRVRAENAAGVSGDSATASATTLAKSSQTIDFPAIGAQIATNVLTLSATASSGLGVSFAVAGGPATISGGTTLSFTGAGTVGIVASQAGNESWNAAPNVTNVFAVSKATAGVSLGGLAQIYDGTPKSATATTVPAGLTVEFTYDDGATAPTAVGSYAVTGTVNDAIYQGSAAGTLVITNGEPLTAFQLWVRDEQSQSLSDTNFAESADYDGDGMTTYQEYLADTDPDSAGSVLDVTGQYWTVSASNAEGKIRLSFPASTNRYYQLVYVTNLPGATVVSNLGWGVPGMAFTNNSGGIWYGRIRALLAAP